MTILENTLHAIIFIGIIIGLFIWIRWGITHKSRVNYILSPILYFLHLGIFYIAAILELIPKDVYRVWINLIYIHSLFVLISAGIVMTQLVKKEVE